MLVAIAAPSSGSLLKADTAKGNICLASPLRLRPGVAAAFVWPVERGKSVRIKSVRAAMKAKGSGTPALLHTVSVWDSNRKGTFCDKAAFCCAKVVSLIAAEGELISTMDCRVGLAVDAAVLPEEIKLPSRRPMVALLRLMVGAVALVVPARITGLTEEVLFWVMVRPSVPPLATIRSWTLTEPPAGAAANNWPLLSTWPSVPPGADTITLLT